MARISKVYNDLNDKEYLDRDYLDLRERTADLYINYLYAPVQSHLNSYTGKCRHCNKNHGNIPCQLWLAFKKLEGAMKINYEKHNKIL